MSFPAFAERAASTDAALMAYISRTRCDCENYFPYWLIIEKSCSALVRSLVC
jgi:hypothetical protein